MEPLVPGSGEKNESIDFFLFNGDGDPSTKNDQVRVFGEIGGGISYDVGIDTDWGAIDSLTKAGECVQSILTAGLSGECDLPEIKAYLYVTPEANARVMFEGAAFKNYEKEYTLATVSPEPILIQVGPLTFTVRVEVVAKIEGAASSRFAVGTSANISATTGLEFGSFSGVHFVPPVPTFDFGVEAAEVTLSGSARVRVGPRLSFKLYDIAGPYAGLYAAAGLDADQG